MKVKKLGVALLLLVGANVFAQEFPPSKVDFQSFLRLAQEVEPYRAKRLLKTEDWLALSRTKNTIILDTRSKEMYDQLHVEGAIHLDFTDFTQTRLDTLIPDKNTNILIYCNNNFANEPIFFATKMYIPPNPSKKEKEILLALNVVTYINLYGYGYHNIYELADFVPVTSEVIRFGGIATENGKVTRLSQRPR